MISLKALFKSSMIYTIGSSIMRLMTFLLLPIYTNILDANGQEWYGNYVLVVTTIAFLRICYSHGIGDSFLKLYSQSEEPKKIVSTYLGYVLLVIIGFSGFIWLANSFINQQSTTNLIGLLQSQLCYIILIVMSDTLNYRVIDILRIKNYALYYMFGQISGIVATLYLAIQYVGNQVMGLEGALLALLYGSIVTLIIFSPIIIQNINFYNFSKSYLQKMLSLGIRFFPAALFFMFMTLLDRYLIKFLLVDPIGNPEYVNNLIGTYSVGAKFASIPMFLISAFNLGWQPFYLSNGKTEEAIRKYIKIGTIFSIVILSVSWIVAIGIPIIATWNLPFVNIPIIGQSYAGFIEIIPIILISHVCYGLYIINMPSIYLCDKQNWSPIFRIFGASINFILNLILIPIYEIKGAAIATALSYAFMFLFLFYKNQKWMPIKLIWSDIIMLTIVITLSIVSIILNWHMKYYIAIITLLSILYLLYKHGIKNLILLFK